MGVGCAYCNPERDENGYKQEVLPILDTDHTMICVLGRTPIMNRRKMGQLEIYNKITGEVTYANLQHCPMCGQPLYQEEDE